MGEIEGSTEECLFGLKVDKRLYLMLPLKTTFFHLDRYILFRGIKKVFIAGEGGGYYPIMVQHSSICSTEGPGAGQMDMNINDG